ncbi:zinc-dependent protease with chaperone function PA4632 [Formosa agariphila KMM 3901]|uniref:Zinc-dependent protease with chaperone function PA4632 n=1 Tax=Formosa agariphila (strain DSM 15362 / KCTC 12365 / LMG 23005 / KMM 3901 / M-2Alg 35-1) TaxID=1347342 RepID=T2KN66_FORAG|nr:M48 family metallopeptidase [Formosa agariphila]CDF79434.1 zinc-dependent protease with chaperone function PA4632 [Formosa agariphila KMM 3901]
MRLKLGILLSILMCYGCATNPFTGKQTMALVSNDQLFPTSFQQYNEFLKSNKVVEGTSAARIKRIGQRIAKASETYLNANGYVGYLDGYKWEYHLIEDEQKNAWCMPGGKIVFYTGILPIAESDAGIAAIMGHEVAHALANHGQQRMSAAYIQQGIAIAGNVAITDEQSRDMFNQYYGIGSEVGGMLPFSRSHESEADRIGIILMAIAGYNPAAAPALWTRMESGNTPELLSTHPANASRIAELSALVPNARAEAKKFGVTTFTE